MSELSCVEPQIPELDEQRVRELLREVEAEVQPRTWQSLGVLALGLWACAPMLWAQTQPWWALLLWTPLTGLGLLICKIALHECAHGSFLPQPKACVALGALLGLPTLTPFWSYKRGHYAHHRWLGTAKDPTPAPDGPVPPKPYLDLLLWTRVLPVFYWAGVYGPYLLYDAFPTAEPRQLKTSLSWLVNVAVILAFHGLVAWWVGPWYLLALGLAFWMASVLYEHLFTMTQHVGLLPVPQGRDEYGLHEQVNFSRSTRFALPGLLFYFNLHKEHHIAPWFSHQRLPALHQRLRAEYPEVFAFTRDDLGLLRRRQQRAHELLTPTIGEPP